MTSETKLDYCMKKSTSGYEHDAGRKEYIWTTYICTVSAHDLFMQNYAGQQNSRYHTDHTHKSRGFVL